MKKVLVGLVGLFSLTGCATTLVMQGFYELQDQHKLSWRGVDSGFLITSGFVKTHTESIPDLVGGWILGQSTLYAHKTNKTVTVQARTYARKENTGLRYIHNFEVVRGVLTCGERPVFRQCAQSDIIKELTLSDQYNEARNIDKSIGVGLKGLGDAITPD